ncbi:MAG: sulfocyanin-like copper-binding protein [Mycobacteriaceae bacterium]
MGGYRYSQLSCSAPTSLPGRLVTVTLADMGMTQMMGGTAPLGVHMRLQSSSRTVAAGTVSLVAENMGWRTHELVILPIDAGATAGHRVTGPDGKVAETGSLGEASASCAAGAGPGITARSTGWITLTLAPGRYELVCNLAHHYADGMWTELTVT